MRAYAGYRKADHRDHGHGVVVMRLRNAIIKVEYGGYTSSPNFDSKKMADGTARSGAVEIGRGVVKALAKCAGCRGRAAPRSCRRPPDHRLT